MTKTILSIIFISAILISGAVAVSVDFTQFAAADKPEKAQGKTSTQYGLKTAGKICGDKLCSEYPGGYEQFKEDRGQSSRIGSEAIEPKIAEEETTEETMEETMEDQTISSSVLKYIQEPPTIDPKKGYFVVEIADGLYWLNDFAYQVMFLTTGEGVIVVDVFPCAFSVLSAAAT